MTLTPSEQSVLRLIAQGMQSKAIAAHLDIALRTVELRRQTAAKKLGIPTRHLPVWAGRNVKVEA